MSFKNNDANQVEPIGYEIDTLAINLRVPWQIVFLPNKSLLFTERTGSVRIIKNNRLIEKPIYKFDDIRVNVKTGLLGMALHTNFSQNGWIYIAHNYTDANNRAKLKVLRFVMKGDTLLHPKVLVTDIPANQNHTGCRLVFGPDKKLYISTGDADQPAGAQDLKQLNGKILRLNDDGSTPRDNPFFGIDTAQQSIWSYGHRNVQGMAFQPGTDLLFCSEHGPTGGDEINIIEKGKNYGWPYAHHQINKSGMVAPMLVYTPSVGPSEAMFYRGDAFPALKNKLLVACLRGEEILSIGLNNHQVISQEVFFKNQFKRIRSLVTGPDGFIYLSTSQYDMPEARGEKPFDMIVRIKPSKNGTQFMNDKIEGNLNGNSDLTAKGLFNQLCATCHGDKLEGTERAMAIKSGKFIYGADLQSISKNINNGILNKGMPAWNGAFDAKQLDELAQYVKALSLKK